MKEQILAHYKSLQVLNSKNEIQAEALVKDNKTHILYLLSLLNQEGLYRSYLPYLMLNETSTHKAVIANLHKYDFAKRTEDYDLVLKQELIAWSDILVFPPLFFDTSDIIDSIKEHKPSIRLYLDIGEDYFRSSLRLPEEELIQLLLNLSAMDNVLFATAQLKQEYEQRTKQLLGKINFGRAVIPNFLHTDMIPTKEESIIKNKKLRIGMQGAELSEAFLKEISTIALEKKEELQFIVYGRPDLEIGGPGTKAMEYHKTVSDLDYLEMIDGLKLDVFLLAPKEAEDLKINSEQLFGEFGLLGIPILCEATHPCGRYIKDGQNGFVIQAEQNYREALCALISRRDSLKSIGRAAQQMTKEHLCWNEPRVQALQKVFASVRY